MTALEAFRNAQDKLLTAAGLTPREVREGRARLAPCDSTRAVEAHRDGCLLLMGDPGTGKSVAAARWMLSEGLALTNWHGFDSSDGFTWKYRGGRLLWRTAKSLSRVQQYDADQMETLLLPARLVVDDIGMEYLDAKGFLSSLIDEIIHERHRRELPTVMTANLSPREFVERYGRRVLDRIAEYREPVLCRRASFRTAPAEDAQRSIAELAPDAEVEARHAVLLEAEATRRAAEQERWERQRQERDEQRAAGVRSIRPLVHSMINRNAEEEAAKEAAEAKRAAEAIAELRRRVEHGGTP